MGKRKDKSNLHRIKLSKGAVYQTQKGGIYYFRYQVNGTRKCVSLKTANQEEALHRAQELLPTIQATNLEIIASHVKVARKLIKKRQSLPLDRVWEVYSVHPEKATPATVHEELCYKADYEEFREFVGDDAKDIADLTREHAARFAEYLRRCPIAVTTHNRKICRLRRVFSTLQGYYDGENPFAGRSLRRKQREEQGKTVRRLAFTREQEEQIRAVLDDPRHRVMNKAEIKVIFYTGMYTGQRLKDCVLLQWQNVDLERGRIMVTQFKTGKQVSFPIAPQLYEVLIDAWGRRVDAYVNPNVAQRYKQTDKRGKCIGDGLVNIDVMRVIRWIGVQTSVAVEDRKKKMTVYGFHSLRHTFASHCAEAGVPKAVVESILGASSEIVDQFYTHVGEDAQRAALEAISGASDDTPATRIKRTLEFIASVANPSEDLQAITQILKGESVKATFPRYLSYQNP